MLEFFRKFLAFIFPVKCILCGKKLDTPYMRICKSCFETECNKVHQKCNKCSTSIDAVYGDMLCQRCRKKRYFDKVMSVFIYKDQIKQALIRYKFYGAKSYSKTFASCMLSELANYPEIYESIDIITFVPIHFIRLGQRGYNQSELMAEYIAEMTGKPIIKTLKCTRFSKPLSTQKHKNRSKLVKGLFKTVKYDVTGLNILILDDILTTGSTISECARVLKSAGAKRVYGITIAHTPKN